MTSVSNMVFILMVKELGMKPTTKYLFFPPSTDAFMGQRAQERWLMADSCDVFFKFHNHRNELWNGHIPCSRCA